MIKKIYKLFLPLIATGGLASSAIASEGSFGKPMQLFRFQTPEMILYVNSTVSLLNSEENPNKRHLNNLLKCQKLLSGSKKLVRGMEIKTLKVCKTYKDKGLYQTSSIRNLKSEIETLKQLIKSNNENQNSNKTEKNQTERQKETLKENIKPSQEAKIKNKSINQIKKDDLDYQEERLLKLKGMFEKGLISEKEYKKLREKTLGF